MTEIAKVLIVTGIVILVIGIILSLLDRVQFNQFKGLPGDIFIQKDNFIFFFPIVTSIVISIILSILFFLIFSVFRKQ
ncbi:MAG: DUF2905 family protein [Spirochaetia bacterium]|nr:DUF2905 family protein [Spirochaetota bacterium]MCX8096467.1 DUF2905 family protein [Spirochaetota bacterium]MDW8112729.1 DUF2905 family protein [Spirochaetia bacterium]